MKVYKCKNSVFCVLFLIIFLFGTICGTLLFHLCAESNSDWATVYCSSLCRSRELDIGSVCVFWLRPLLFVLIAAVLNVSVKALFALVYFRGLFVAFVFCAFGFAGFIPMTVVLRNVLLMPVFYYACRIVFERRIRHRVLRGYEYESFAGNL